MDVPINFQGNYHHIEISEGACLQIAQGVTMRSFTSLEVFMGAILSIEEGVFFNDHCSIRCTEKITIGRDTMFGDGVRIFDSNHKFNNYHVFKTAMSSAPIHIGRDCWIGANTVILRGVTFGDNVVIGANCLIYQDIPSNSIVTHSEQLKITSKNIAKFHAFVYTYSDQLEGLEYLLISLPEVDFHVAAPTNVSDYLRSFERFKNFQLYEYCQSREVSDRILEMADFYLDINHWNEVDDIIGRALERGKPIFAFENVVHRKNEEIHVFSLKDEDKMVATIRHQLKVDRNGE